MIIRYYSIINDIKKSFITSVRNSDFTTHNNNILRKENIQKFYIRAIFEMSLSMYSTFMGPLVADLASTATVTRRTSSLPLRICGCTAW